MKTTILNETSFSPPFEGEQPVSLVLARIDKPYGSEFVTWFRNDETGGFFWGHYFMDQTRAEQDYRDRIGREQADRERSAELRLEHCLNGIVKPFCREATV